MLGMIFGVAAVIAMLSIGAGAQQQVIAFIEQLGVRNVIVEAREAGDSADAPARPQALGRADASRICDRFRRTSTASSPSTARKRLAADQAAAEAAGRRADGLRRLAGVPGRSPACGVTRGRFFDDAEDAAAAPVAVLGQAATAGLFGGDDPIGQFVKVNQQWFRVIGVAGSAARGAGRRRRPARAGPQQPDLRAAHVGASCASRTR